MKASGSENNAKRLYLISPVIWSLVALVPDVVVHVKETLNGNRLDANVQFDFALSRGKNYICIVQANDDMFREGMAQALLGCETASDLDGSREVYGIVTTLRNGYS